MISHYIKDPESLEMIRGEFRKVVIKDQLSNFKEYGKVNKEKMLKELCCFENIQDLEYLSWVMYEALRITPPAIVSTNF